MGLPKYDWEQKIEMMIAEMDSKKDFSIKSFASANGLPYFELCRQWANSPKYRPIVASDERKRYVHEGNTSFQNFTMPEKDIKFMRLVKSLTSPVRFYIVKFLIAGPRTIAEFIAENHFAWFTTHHAFLHLERAGIIEVCGKAESFNVWRLRDEQAVRQVLGGLEAMLEQ